MLPVLLIEPQKFSVTAILDNNSAVDNKMATKSRLMEANDMEESPSIPPALECCDPAFYILDLSYYCPVYVSLDVDQA